MTRLAITVVAVVAVIIGVYMLGRQHDRASDANREADTLERINDAQDRSRACGDGWYDRLLCSE